MAISILHGISSPPGGHGHFSACLPPATGSSLPPGPPPRPGTAVHCIQSFSVSPRILCSLASFQVAAFSSFKARGRPPRRAFSFPRKVLSLGCSGAGAASSAHRRLRLKRGVHGDTARWVWGWPVTALRRLQTWGRFASGAHLAASGDILVGHKGCKCARCRCRAGRGRVEATTGTAPHNTESSSPKRQWCCGWVAPA